MAAEDFIVADRPLAGLTAGDKVAQVVQETPDADAKAAAETAGVSNAAYIGYADALETFQERDDIETLADRRARDNASTFGAADFMRATPSGTPPTPGTPDGHAPASA